MFYRDGKTRPALGDLVLRGGLRPAVGVVIGGTEESAGNNLRVVAFCSAADDCPAKFVEQLIGANGERAAIGMVGVGVDDFTAGDCEKVGTVPGVFIASMRPPPPAAPLPPGGEKPASVELPSEPEPAPSPNRK